MKINEMNINGMPLIIADHAGSATTYWLQQEFNSGGYSLDTVEINPEDTVIDIGANVGVFSIYVAKKFGCKVISFEPVESIYKHAVGNIKINEAKNIEIHNCGILDKSGLFIMSLDPKNTGGSSQFKNGNFVQCKSEPLQKFIENEKNLKYLKIDCEGGEYSIIPSILHELNKFKYIAIEYHKYNDRQDPVKLHQMILDNFDGTLIHNDPNHPVTW